MELLIQKFKSLLEKFEKFNSIKFGKSCNKILKGGSGSGNFGHAGRVGEVGGSSSESSSGGGKSSNKLSMNEEAKSLLENAKGKIKGLNEKESIDVASDIARYEKSDIIEPAHIAEAVQIVGDKDGIKEAANSISYYKLFDKEFPLKATYGFYNRMNDIGQTQYLDKNLPKLVNDVGNKIRKLTEESSSLIRGFIGHYIITYDKDKSINKIGVNELKTVNKILDNAKNNTPKGLAESIANYTKGIKKGGSGSGHFGHSGRPGEVGGSDGDGGDGTNNTPGSGVKENLFDADNAMSIVADRLDKEIKAPYINTDVSTLGGKENASVLLTMSLDPKESWTNGILHNSRYSMFHLDRKGRLEQFSRGFTVKDKFRTTTVKSVDQAISKINDYIDKVK